MEHNYIYLINSHYNIIVSIVVGSTTRILISKGSGIWNTTEVSNCNYLNYIPCRTNNKKVKFYGKSPSDSPSMLL